MSGVGSGILDLSIDQTPFAVIDFETTGLSPGVDRVVEVSVVRVEPGRGPELVFDTMVNPRRPMAATEIHGITDEDVADAPCFEDIVREFVRAAAGCVVAAYNVYFDIRFLEFELRAAGIPLVPPHVCLMYMRPMLGIGRRCPLGDACQVHGIANPMAHAASADAMAAAELTELYLREFRRQGIRTFGDLRELKSYKFLDSFRLDPFQATILTGQGASPRLKSRAAQVVGMRTEQVAAVPVPPPASPSPLGEYWDALKAAMADLQITDEELQDLTDRKLRLGLDVEQIRMLHARLFAGVITKFTEDKWLDDEECVILNRVHAALARLGWAPGDPPGGAMGHSA